MSVKGGVRPLDLLWQEGPLVSFTRSSIVSTGTITQKVGPALARAMPQCKVGFLIELTRHCATVFAIATPSQARWPYGNDQTLSQML